MKYKEERVFEKIKKQKKQKKTFAKLFSQPQLDKEIEKAEQKIRRGVWQYMFDHATVNKKGLFIGFVVVNQDNFWKRVKARQDREYYRNEEVDKKVMQKEIFFMQRDNVITHKLAEKKDNFLKHPLVWLVWKLWFFVRKQEKNITSEREIYEKFSLFYSIDREN